MEWSAHGSAGLLGEPGTVLILVCVLLLCLFSTVVNLRNARLWMLRLAGVSTSGVVDALEIVTDANGEVLRRPRVKYTTKDGMAIRATPMVFRATTPIAIGASVRVSYAAKRPERMVVHGFDFRVREPVYAAASLAIAIAIVAVYYALWRRYVV
jgi:uncharacterized membrane protein YbhN (UPF0104 family)